MSAVTPSAIIVQMKKKAPLDLAISPSLPTARSELTAGFNADRVQA